MLLQRVSGIAFLTPDRASVLKSIAEIKYFKFILIACSSLNNATKERTKQWPLRTKDNEPGPPEVTRGAFAEINMILWGADIRPFGLTRTDTP